METNCAVRVMIRRNSDGQLREYEDEYGRFDDGKYQDFIWSEGNFSCDCNRDLFWHRAGGEPDPDDNPCGDERYDVEIMDSAGRVLYSELRPDAVMERETDELMDSLFPDHAQASHHP